mgnify:CR=1 FL=1
MNGLTARWAAAADGGTVFSAVGVWPLLALLADGSGGENVLLSTDLARAMWRQAATVHPEIPGWGLGLQLDRVHGVDIAEHGGDIGGFSALFVLIPEADAGFFIVHHGEGGEMRFRVKQALLDALFPPLAVPVVPPANPSEAGRLAEYAGRYLSSIACRSCPDAEVQARLMCMPPHK